LYKSHKDSHVVFGSIHEQVLTLQGFNNFD